MNYLLNCEPRINPPEDRAIAICAECGQEIYDGEIYGQLGGECCCRDCIRDVFEALTEEERFERLGYSVEGGYTYGV